MEIFNRNEDEEFQVRHTECEKLVGLPDGTVQQAAGTEELKLEKQVRSGDKELEVIHVEVIVEAERVDEVTWKCKEWKRELRTRPWGQEEKEDLEKDEKKGGCVGQSGSY